MSKVSRSVLIIRRMLMIIAIIARIYKIIKWLKLMKMNGHAFTLQM